MTTKKRDMADFPHFDAKTIASPIPQDTLGDRLAFLGMAGSGKTYTAGVCVERLLLDNRRCVIIDPLGVWWGLRLRPNGKDASQFDVPIFGGDHGDLVLTENAGQLIGETVAGMQESCILDLSGIGTKAGERRFMLPFLTALYGGVDSPVYLICDESDMYAPQQLLDKEGEAAKLLGMMETIVRRGRVRGFIPWLITQRPAVLSKNILSQADGIVSFKLTGSQDRDAIGAWIEGQAYKQQGKAILASLPSLQRGEAVIWIPARGILKTESFPEKLTFDSSRTPKWGEKLRAKSLKPLDLGKLKERLATIEAETKANDPKLLKAEIVRLRRELAAKSVRAPDPAQKPAAKPQPKPMEKNVKESEAKALREENATMRHRVAQLEAAHQTSSAGPPSSEPATISAIDMGAIYAYVKHRATNDPELLAVIMRRPEIQVAVTRHTIHTDDSKLVGMLAILISEGFFDSGATGNAAYDELKRRGKSVAKPSVYRVADQLAEKGFLTKEASGYRAVADMKVNILDAA